MAPVGCSATPVVLEQWFAAFGLGEKPQEDVTDTSDDTFFHQEYATTGIEISPDQRTATALACDPAICRMHQGVCCDCCKCQQHCQCGDLKVLPPTCDTPECSERVCPSCMRCHNHCLCRSTNVKAEHDGYYLAYSPTSIAVASPAESVSPSSKKASTAERIAPPPLLSEEESARVARDRSSLVSFDDDDESYNPYGSSSADWMGHNTRLMTSKTGEMQPATDLAIDVDTTCFITTPCSSQNPNSPTCWQQKQQNVGTKASKRCNNTTVKSLFTPKSLVFTAKSSQLTHTQVMAVDT